LQKILAPAPPEALVKHGLGEQARLIGTGALLSALLLLIPRTSSLGIFLTSSFWGGAICIHMAHGEPYLFQAVTLVLSWTGAYLRNPRDVQQLFWAWGLLGAGSQETSPAPFTRRRAPAATHPPRFHGS
jgi:hypothetical protein